MLAVFFAIFGFAAVIPLCNSAVAMCELSVPGTMRTYTAYKLQIACTEPVTVNIKTYAAIANDRFLMPMPQLTLFSFPAVIDYVVPISNMWRVSLNLIAKRMTSGKIIHNTTSDVFLQMPYFKTIIQTEKPVYGPGNDVIFRVVTVDERSLRAVNISLMPIFRREYHSENRKYVVRKNTIPASHYEHIEVRTPRGYLVSRWRDVGWVEAIKGFRFFLSPDPLYGRWSINAKNILGHSHGSSFTVYKYVLDKFVVQITLPTTINLAAESDSYTVCANYLHQGAVLANISSFICLYSYYYRGCLFRKSVTQNGCVTFDFNTTEFDFRNSNTDRFTYYANATIVEQSSGITMTKSSEISATLITTPFYIEMNFEENFKPPIPVVGDIVTKRHDGTVFANASLTCRVDMRSYVLQFPCSTDSRGRYHFSRFIDSNATSFTLTATSTCYTEKVGYVKLKIRDVYRSITMTRWHSLSENYLYVSTNRPATCGTEHMFKLVANSELHASEVVALVVSDGVVMSSQKLALQKYACIDRDDDYGHYTCDGLGAIKCLSGWHGADCLMPLCNRNCGQGRCSLPGICHCDSGWNGVNCDSCLPKLGCENGNCKFGGDCVCYEGWAGELCDVRSCRNLTRLEVSFAKASAPKNLEPEMASVPFRSLSEYHFSANIPTRVANAYLIVYYLEYKTMEYIADGLRLIKKPCTNNPDTKLTFSKKSSVPNDFITVNVTTGSNVKSHCSLSILDVGLSSRMSAAQVSLEDFLSRSSDATAANQHPGYKCRSNGSYWSSSNYVDSSLPFSRSGLVFHGTPGVLLASRPCSQRSIFYSRGIMAESGVAAKSATTSLGSSPIGTSAQVRNFFPHSWFFFYIQSSFDLRLVVPDSMTTWIANMWCVTATGIGVAPVTELLVRKTAFVTLDTPFSLVRGESTTTYLNIHSYTGCIKTRVVVKTNEMLTVSVRKFEHMVCSNRSRGVKMTLKGSGVGHTYVTVYLYTWPVDVNDPKISDVLNRTLVVEPEGVQREQTDATLICKKNTSFRMNISVPNEHIPGSARAYLTVSGNLFGSALDNLNRLIRLPSGCGEQNILAMIPSLVILMHWEDTGIDDRRLRLKAEYFLQIGYQQQLYFRLNSGSFSVFAAANERGNTWLTALVYNTFVKARKFITIDDTVIDNMRRYLSNMQNKDGSFSEFGISVTNNFRSSGSRNGTLAAFVLASVSEGNCKLDNVTIAATSYIHYDTTKHFKRLTTFDIVMRTYALTVCSMQPSKILIAEFWKRKTVAGNGETYWGDVANGMSSKIETTGYAVMTMIAVRAPVSDIQPSIRWLVKYRNQHGGWFSSRDTSVAFQALVKYMSYIGFSRLERKVIYVRSVGSTTTRTVVIDEDNEYNIQKIALKAPAELLISATGTGCVSVQTNVLFNEMGNNTNNFFNLSINTKVAPDCKSAIFRVCSAYLYEKSNMALVTIPLPSGWQLKKNEEQNIVKRYRSVVERVQTNTMNVVYIYMTPLTRGLKCFEITTVRRFVVHHTQPSKASILDFYYTERKDAVTFDLQCGPQRTCPRCPATFDVCSILTRVLFAQKVGGTNWRVSFPPFQISSRMIRIDWSNSCACSHLDGVDVALVSPTILPRLPDVVYLTEEWVILNLTDVKRALLFCS